MNLKPYRLICSLMFLSVLTIQPKATKPENCLLFSITSQNTARLGVINTGRRSLDLTITNSAGEIFYTKSVRGENNFFQMLNLANMPDGNYTVKLIDGTNTTEKLFTISNSLAKIIKTGEILEPKFIMPDERTLIISYFNKHSNAINIFFMLDDEIVFEDRGLSDIALSKRYSLKQLPSGKYIVKLYSGGKVFSYPLVLN